MQVATDLLATAILGPWVKTTATTSRRRQVYLSLAHWYEAAKFMPHKPDLRDSLLFSPSIKEARKFARMRQTEWRTDWPVTRHSVLVAGLGLLAIQRPEMQLRTAPLTHITAGLRPLELPERFVETCVALFDSWRTAPRLSVFGAEATPIEVVSIRLTKIAATIPTWTLVSPCHRRTAWRVHDWALTQYIPVDYVGSPTQRPRRPLSEAILEASDQVVVFEQRRSRRFDQVLQTAKALRKKVHLELFDGEGQANSQLSMI